ncbi:YhgE/Pip domain-containing protein [Nocardia altamirensis]|uniref:YhgE/Pip domain-containing protein n=1 Tax=Nocardia altamirensis TaxID=472158 RepID=UPI0008402D68|nr:ABC transporter permease [Nocardia altamirensis]
MKVTHRFARHPGTWLPPLVVMFVLAIALPAVYLGGTLDPSGNLKDFPIAMVVEPQTSSANNAANQVRTAVEAAVNHDAITFVPMTVDEEKEQMGSGKIFGAVRIPANFNAEIARLTTDSAGPPAHAVLHLDTAPASGALSSGLFTGQLAPVVAGVSAQFGKTLAAKATTVSAATALAAPFTVAAAPLVPLAAHTGLGTSVFYYAIVLVLLGFVGASAMHPIIDSAIGFQPSEMGPKVRRRGYTHLSRLHTLLIKWSVMLLAAPLCAAGLQFVAGTLLDMPIPAPWQLFLFSTTTIAAVGIGALTVFAMFGSLGPLINMFFFIALAMISSAGTIPLEATPAFFRAIADIEPMRPIVTGLRSILYYDSAPLSGLETAWVDVAIIGAAGALIGAIATSLFDRVPAFTRHPQLAGNAPA